MWLCVCTGAWMALPVRKTRKTFSSENFRFSLSALTARPPPSCFYFSLLCRLSRKPKCELNVWKSSTKLYHQFLNWRLGKKKESQQKICFLPLVWLWKEYHEKLEGEEKEQDVSSPRLPLQNKRGPSPLKHVNRMNPFSSLWWNIMSPSYIPLSHT